MDYFEVLRAPVEYIDEPGVFKNRPVLRINETPFSKVTLDSKITTIKITSKPKRAGKYVEYELHDWRAAGLSRPSTVRLSTLFSSIVKKDIYSKLGDLSRADALNISVIMKEKAHKIGIYP